MVSKASGQQGKADDAVKNDHQHGEHRVAPQCRYGLRPQHGRADQRNFDDDDGKRQDERSEWFAETLGNFLGFMHNPERRPGSLPEAI